MRLTTSVTAVLIYEPKLKLSHTSVCRLFKEGKEAISIIFLRPTLEIVTRFMIILIIKDELMFPSFMLPTVRLKSITVKMILTCIFSIFLVCIPKPADLLATLLSSFVSIVVNKRIPSCAPYSICLGLS